MKLLKNIIGLIHGIRPFYLSRLIFCLSSFYEFTAKVGNKMPQILEPKYRKSWKQNVNKVYIPLVDFEAFSKKIFNK